MQFDQMLQELTTIWQELQLMSTQPEIHAGFKIILPFDPTDLNWKAIALMAKQLEIRVRPTWFELYIRDDADFEKVQTQLKKLYDQIQQHLQGS